MNIVLTGATGFVGSEVLSQLLAHREVQGVTCLTRRSPEVQHPKLTALVHTDFGEYEDALVARLADHVACIWTLGGKASDFRSTAEYERVTHDFTLAFADVVGRSDKFTFCYLSGMGADPSESSRLPWQRQTRHLKGRTERDLEKVASASTHFKNYSFRPGGILPCDGSRLGELLFRPIAVRVDVLANAMIDVALHGAARTVISNAAIKAIAARSRSGSG